MASIFELGDIPGGLLPGTSTLASVTNTATLTAAQSYNSIVRGIPTSTATYTTETAAAIISAIGGDCAVGTSFRVVVLNAAATAITITVAGGTGVTVSGVATVVQNASKEFIGYVANVTAGSQAITLYGLGSTGSAVA
jgi:hypothetical protein